MRSWLYSPQKLHCLSWCHWFVCRLSQGWCQRCSGRSSRSLKRGGRRWSFPHAPRCAWAPRGSWRRPRDWWVPDVPRPSFPCRNWCGGRALPAPTGAGSAADLPAMAPAVRDGDVCWRPDLLVAAMSSFPAEMASNIRFFISFLVPWADKWSPSTRNRPLSISPLWYVKLSQLSTYVQPLSESICFSELCTCLTLSNALWLSKRGRNPLNMTLSDMETRLASAMISHTYDIILSHGNFVAQSFVPTWITTSACESVCIFFSIDSISHVFVPPREFTVRDLGLVDLMSRIVESPTRRVVASFSARSFDSRWLVLLSDFSCAVNVLFDSVRV